MDKLSIIYCRQSVEKKDSLSIEGQEDKCKALLNKGEVYKLIKDEGWSGKSLDRPGFKNILQLIEENKVDKLLVYKLDRCTRSLLDFANLTKLFKEHDVTFISASENLDLSSPAGIMMCNILASFAEFERESIRQRVKDSYFKRLEEGSFTGGTIILGYSNIKKLINGKNMPVLESNQDSTIIKEMFDIYANNNISLRKLAFEINRKYNTNYDSSMISKYLRNPIYVKADIEIYKYYKNNGYTIYNKPEEFIGENGCFLVNKSNLYIGLHEGFIDSKTFLKVQYKLKLNKQLKRTGTGNKSWLVNLYCSKCGHKLSFNTNRINKTYIRCRTKERNNKCDGITTTKAEDIESLMTDLIINKLSNLKNEKINLKNNNEKEINNIKIKITDIENKINIYLSKILYANELTMKYINNEIEKLENEKYILNNELNNLILLDNKISLKYLIEDNIDFNSLPFNKKRDIMNTLVNKVVIGDNDINVIWNV